MSKLLLLILALALSWSGPVCAEDGASMDIVMQKVLRENGVESKILRPYRLVDAPSTRGDGRFLFNFEGIPGIEVVLERNYWVLVALNTKKDDDAEAYMFNPKDGQSALNISIGRKLHRESDDALSKSPGFSGIKSGRGGVGSQKVTWRRWSDQEHLYSDCSFVVPSQDKRDSSSDEVEIRVTANSEERRKALESCMKSFRLLSADK